MTQETAFQNIKNLLKSSIENQKTEELKRKAMHGQSTGPCKTISRSGKSLAPFCSSGLKGETESLIIAAQYKALNRRYHQRNIMNQPTASKRRMCYKAEEHTKHTVVGCTTLGKSEYTNRHNKVGGYNHWTIREHMGSRVTNSYYEHILETAINVNGTTIMWDILVFTNRTVLAYRPNRVLHDKKGTISLLIDIATPDDLNVNTQETEQLSKYKDLEIEVSRMWKVRAIIVSVIIGALGTIKKGSDKNLQLLPGHPSAIELQKVTLKSTAYFIRKVLG